MDVRSRLIPARLGAVPMPTYRALSLDLWFTTLYYELADEAEWRQDRLTVLSRGLRDEEGRPLARDRLAAATDRVRADLRASNRDLDTLDPGSLVRAIATHLNARVSGDVEALAAEYSAAGFDRRPPRLAEGVTEVCRALTDRGVPVVAISNTARREASWRALFERAGGPSFRHILTSCELGRKKPDPALFREAARRLGLDPSSLLHVGDRWELDVAGALGAGCGAVMFRGLWSRYPAAGYADGTLPPNDGPGAAGDDAVPRIDRIDELLNVSRFSFAAP